METEWQRRERKKQKKEEMLRLCRLLDVKDWDKNEQIAQKVRSIIHKEEKVKNKEMRKPEYREGKEKNKGMRKINRTAPTAISVKRKASAG